MPEAPHPIRIDCKRRQIRLARYDFGACDYVLFLTRAGKDLSYDFTRLLCYKGAAAWHGIYAVPGSGGGRIEHGLAVMGRAVV